MEINTQNWQMAIAQVGIVSNLDDVRQCIATILGTRKGSVPLYPSFGCAIFDYIDKPVNTMVPASKKSIIDAISQFEPRVTVERIDHTFPDIGQVMYHIYLSTVDGQTFQVDYNTAGGNLTPGRQLIILQATYSPSASRYYINLTIDSAQYSGLPAGYPNINALWLWVNEQWPTLGTWRFSPTSNKISVFVYASSGSLVISSLNGVQALFPPLDSGEFYMVQFNGSYSDQGLFTIADVIQWVRLNWGDGGEWSTDGAYLIYQSNSLTNDTLEITADEYGGFSSGFNTGFSI